MFSSNQISFENLNFYIIKTVNIKVYGNIAVYGKKCSLSV